MLAHSQSVVSFTTDSISAYGAVRVDSSQAAPLLSNRNKPYRQPSLQLFLRCCCCYINKTSILSEKKGLNLILLVVPT